MHVEILVEELSAEAALMNLLPRLLGDHTYQIHPFQGKDDLLTKLPDRLSGYALSPSDDQRILVLIDEDRQDCLRLKSQLEDCAQRAGLVTRSQVGTEYFQVLNRIAVEELEAWFFGDVEALVAAYPAVPATLGNRANYRDPDAVPGGTWEALERVLKRAGYYPTGLAKLEAASRISMHMDPERNRSRSFQVFRDGLLDLVR